MDRLVLYFRLPYGRLMCRQRRLYRSLILDHEEPTFPIGVTLPFAFDFLFARSNGSGDSTFRRHRLARRAAKVREIPFNLPVSDPSLDESDAPAEGRIIEYKFPGNLLAIDSQAKRQCAPIVAANVTDPRSR